MDALNAEPVKLEKFIERCTWVWTIYTYYKSLYESEEATLDLLGKYSYLFFRDLQEVLTEYLLVQMCSLTDPENTGSNSNLTINSLFRQVAWPADIEMVLRSKIQWLNEFIGPIKIARNKVIAHSDEKTALGGNVLGSFAEGADGEFFDQLEEVVNVMHAHIVGGPYSIKVLATQPIGQLISNLRHGLSMISTGA